MINGFADTQNAATQNLDRVMESFGVWSRGVQSVALESAEVSRKAFEDTAAHVQTLLAAESVQRAAEVQTAFVTSSYERSVEQASRFAALFTGLATDMAKPFEGVAVPTK